MEFVQRLKNNKFLIISCLIVFIFALGIRIFYATQKAGFQVDETTSVYLANIAGHLKYPEKNWLSGKELKEGYFFYDSSFKSALKDIKQLHIDNGDPPHTNLYYTLFRIALINADYPSVDTIKIRGISLNLLFFVMSYVLMYKILMSLFKDDKVFIPFGLLVAFCNTGAVSNTLFLRPYQLQETCFLLLVYICIKFFADIKNGTLVSAKNLLLASFSLALTLLTGYLAPLLIMLLGGALIFACIKEKYPEAVLFFIRALGISILFAMMFYLGYLDGFFSYRAEEAVEKLHLFENIFSSADGVFRNLISFLFYLPCLILLGVVFVRRLFLEKKLITNNIVPLLLVISLIWITIVMFFVPFKIVRYIMAIFPILSMLYIYSMYGYFDKMEKYCYISLISVLMIFFVLFPVKVESRDNTLITEDYISPYAPKLENLFLNVPQMKDSLEQNKELTLVFWGKGFISLHILPFLSDEQYCIWRRGLGNLPDEDALLLIGDEPELEVDLKKYRIKEKINMGYGTFFSKIEKKYSD